MEERMRKHIDVLVCRYPQLQKIKSQIESGYQLLKETYKDGNKLLLAGNGGSAADAEHITGELMKSFKQPRSISGGFAKKLREIDTDRGRVLAAQLEQVLPAISLTGCGALATAYMNDVGNSVFAQQLFGYGRTGDAFLAISTSGNSQNIVDAAIVAKAVGIKVLALTGKGGGMLAKFADVLVAVPEGETYMVQELHLPIYHCWCLLLEEYFFGKKIGSGYEDSI